MLVQAACYVIQGLLPVPFNTGAESCSVDLPSANIGMHGATATSPSQLRGPGLVKLHCIYSQTEVGRISTREPIHSAEFQDHLYYSFNYTTILHKVGGYEEP